MYEKPKLNKVGRAEEVILGLIPTGMDLDGNNLDPEFEFAMETEAGE